MKAWLVTWDWCGEHAKPEETLIALFSARKSESTIADFVEQHYLFATATAHEIAYYANRVQKRPYKAMSGANINSVPHGDRVYCGHNPFIYARIVLDLTVQADSEEGMEIVRWKEPPVFKWANDSKERIVVDREGLHEELSRSNKPLI